MRRLSAKSLFRIHSWIGLHCGVVLFTICLSGAVATVSEEIDWCIYPAFRVSPAGEPLAWDALEARTESQISDASVVAIHAPRNDHTACMVEIETGCGQRGTFLVNQYTGEIQGRYAFHSVKMLFRIFHKQFYIYGIPEGIHGTYLVGSYGIALFAAGITGLLFYKRFWKGLWLSPWRRRPSVAWRDWHRFLGVWTSLLLLVWSATGIWYLAQMALHDSTLHTGEVIDQRKPETFNALDRWAVTADALHFGTLGGLPTKIIWFVFGVGASLAIPIGACRTYIRGAPLSAPRRTRRPVLGQLGRAFDS